MKRLRKDNREKYIRVALVAATIVNVHRRKGTKLVRPEDFIREPPRPQDYMDVQTAKRFMDTWARAMNARAEPSSPATS